MAFCATDYLQRYSLYAVGKLMPRPALFISLVSNISCPVGLSAIAGKNNCLMIASFDLMEKCNAQKVATRYREVGFDRSSAISFWELSSYKNPLESNIAAAKSGLI